MQTFLSKLVASVNSPIQEEVAYLQSQDGNIHRSCNEASYADPELVAFAKYLETDITWMKDATGHVAEAVNLWIGTNQSTTSFHHDPYDNVHHVLSGSKTFTLISPIEGLWLTQRFYPSSILVRGSDGRLRPVPDNPSSSVPWVESLDVPPDVQAMRVTVRVGESLYLPAEWWHKVEQMEGPGGLAVAINL